MDPPRAQDSPAITEEDHPPVSPPPVPRRASKRERLAAALRRAGIEAALLHLPSWRGVAILSYHRIGERERSDLYRGVFSATPEEFDRQLTLLRRHFRVIGPEDLAEHVRRGRGRAVMITFDDGYRDLHDTAFPLLEAHGIKATMFLCSGLIDGAAAAWWDEMAWMIRRASVGSLPPGSWGEASIPLQGSDLERAIELATRHYWELPHGAGESLLDELAVATGSGRRPPGADRQDWVTWEMARELHEAGHRIGAHTVTHPILGRLEAAAQRAEIAGSADRIEAEIGERPRWLAYPVGTHGTFTAETRSAAREAGIELAFSNYGGYVTRGTFAADDVRRLSSETLRTDALFSASLTIPQVFARVAD